MAMPAANASRVERKWTPRPQTTAGEIRMHAGDDLHQRALACTILADETMDLAGKEGEVHAAQRLDAAE